MISPYQVIPVLLRHSDNMSPWAVKRRCGENKILVGKVFEKNE